MALKVGVVGATGVVGEQFCRLIEERNFPIKELRPFASAQSAGKTIRCQNKDWTIQSLDNNHSLGHTNQSTKDKVGASLSSSNLPEANGFEGLDLVFFSSGDDISKKWAPEAVAQGAFAIDNSAAFRMDPNTALVVPEINGSLVDPSKPQIIANPNCSTIQLVMTLKPLRDRFGLEDVHVATYQATSGAGKAAQKELLDQTKSELANEPMGPSQNFPETIAFNCLPQIGSFNDEGFCSEEEKIMRETQKILDEPSLKVSAFTVRVPVLNAHAEAVWVNLKEPADKNDILSSWSNFSGLEVMAEPQTFPNQRQSSGKNATLVGRLHKDRHWPNKWIYWVVSDNLRKGAALNGIQIAEQIFDISETP